MIRGALRIALAGAGVSYALDRMLAKQSAGDEPDPIQSMIVIDAPIERVWAEVAAIEQPRWMHDMKSVQVLTPGWVWVGTEAVAEVRIFGISVKDLVRWRGDVIAPVIRDLGVALAMRHEPETLRMVLTAQMGKAGPPMDGKDLHVGDFELGRAAGRPRRSRSAR